MNATVIIFRTYLILQLLKRQQIDNLSSNILIFSPMENSIRMNEKLMKQRWSGESEEEYECYFYHD